MSLPEVATYLGMAERTIYVWAQQGTIPAFKLGTSWRFRRSEIDAWLETQRSGPNVSGNLLVDPVEPPTTRAVRTEQNRAATEAQIEACVAYINTTMLNDDRNVWVVDQFVDQFGDDIVKEALKRLTERGKVRVGEQKDRGQKKVRVIRRRD